MENNISKVEKENDENANNKEQFSWIIQSLGFLIGIILAFLIVLPLIILIYLAKMNTNANSIYEALIWASIGGFFGGAARSMFKYIRQVNDRNVDEVFWRLRRWFLYLPEYVFLNKECRFYHNRNHYRLPGPWAETGLLRLPRPAGRIPTY